MNRLVLVALLLAGSQDARAQEATLIQGPLITFPADVDSNSPAFWAEGRLRVFNSTIPS